MRFFRSSTRLLATLIFLAGNASAEITEIAKPRAYKPIEATQIGTRDDDLGVANGHQVGPVQITGYEGNAVALSDLWQEQPLMVIFYRGGWCPFCNMQIKELSDHYAEFEAAGVLPVLISVDKPDAASLTTQTYDIPFPVLSDQTLVAHNEFNVVNKLSDEQKQRAAGRGLDFAEWAGNDHGVIGVASSFLVDTKGVVQWSTVLKDFTKRPTKDQLIAAINAWKTSP